MRGPIIEVDGKMGLGTCPGKAGVVSLKFVSFSARKDGVDKVARGRVLRRR